ncbi:hypothetical protein [Nakamurella leprariae]|uniref:Uncharacterized protein n=1 Tax=Nakamurella leprariae TaxID=2803911 RepID=A0A938YDK1_9ACTN|nr:hypothetical protein [Nakamurella leprariae]MBM9468722.1 hypothetical protein [Nakamurella leprariae]
MAELWAFSGTALVLGLVLTVFAGPVAAWNRRASTKLGRGVAKDSEPSGFLWTAKYLRIVGGVMLVFGVAVLIKGLTSA